MKSPSKNISASLRSQSEGGRSPLVIKMGKLSPASAVSMIVPGDGGIEGPPGFDGRSTRTERSAHHYADAAGIVK